MPTLLDFAEFMQDAWAVYPMSSFGHDTVGNLVWEKKALAKDLVFGDGLTAGTFPSFVEHTGHETAYYSFDGVDDYFSAWPTMPDEYTVMAALSPAYPSGKPYVQSCTDTTVETLLSTSGAFAGNVHGIIIFAWVLSPLQLAYAEQRMLRRLWRDTFVDPFTARLIRSGDCAICLYCEDEANRFNDYSTNAIGSTDYSTVWEAGLTFPVSGAALVMDSDEALNLDALTIFLEAPNFDTEAIAETVLANGTNYELTVGQSAGICTVALNGSELSFPAVGHITLAVSASPGQYPRFYLDGEYAGEGDSIVSIYASDAGQLTLGNNSSRDNPFASTLKKLSIYSAVLSNAEVRAAHIMARQDR